MEKGKVPSLSLKCSRDPRRVLARRGTCMCCGLAKETIGQAHSMIVVIANVMV